MIVLSVVLLLTGGALYLLQRDADAWLQTLRGVAQRAVADLRDDAAAVQAELGAGSYRAHATLLGAMRCEAPLLAPSSGRACVYFEVEVWREYEEVVTRIDEDGRHVHETRSGRTSVIQHREGADFDLDDGTGLVRVEAEGARYEGLQRTQERFVPVESFGQPAARERGGQLIPWPWMPRPAPATPGRKTLGYRCRERIMPVLDRVTVIGAVSDVEGRLAARRDEAALIISTRAREVLVQRARRRHALLRVGCRAALLGGAAVAVLALVR